MVIDVTLDTIYNSFIRDVILNEKNTILSFTDFLTSLLEYSYSVRNLDLIKESVKMIRIYDNSIIYYDNNIDNRELVNAILSINEENISILEKIDDIVCMFSFYCRLNNKINLYENRLNLRYSSRCYIIYGKFLNEILDPFYDWIVPIIGSKKIEIMLEKLSISDSLSYLMAMYYHFYNLFFPYNNQNLELFSIYSDIDMFYANGNLNFISDESVEFIYRNIREIQSKTLIKKH